MSNLSDEQIAQIEKLAWKHARVKWSTPPGYQFDDAELIEFAGALIEADRAVREKGASPLAAFVQSSDEDRGKVYARVIPAAIAMQGASPAPAARALFDNRLGWGDGRNPYAPRELWADLGAALYGETDARVIELRAALAPSPAGPTPDYAALEAEHFGDPIKQTGIYAPLTDEQIEALCLARQPGYYHFDERNKEQCRRGMRAFVANILELAAAPSPEPAEPPALSMSMFASREDYERARFEAWWLTDATPEEMDAWRIDKGQPSKMHAWIAWRARAKAEPAEPATTPLAAFVRSSDEERGRVYERVIPVAIAMQTHAAEPVSDAREREMFEAHISGPPYEKNVRRFSQDSTRWAWPGGYQDLDVDLAWHAWFARAALTAPTTAGDKE
jgi:hypothetical protein